MKFDLWCFAQLCAFHILLSHVHPTNCMRLSARIAGGSEAQESHLRGIVSLQLTNNSQNYEGHFCGGTWVRVGNESLIVTAAHCVLIPDTQIRQPIETMRVMGDDLKILGKASPRRQFRNISKVIIHPSYSYNDIPLYGSRRNIDIAVLFLKSPFNETETFGPIELADEVVEVNETCQFYGWGLREYGSKKPSPVLLSINFTVIPRDVCNGPYDGAVGEYAFCGETMEDGAGVCSGDSGGGLLKDGKLVGVVAFGGIPLPGVFTDVLQLKNWIEQATPPNDTDTEVNIEFNFVFSDPNASLMAKANILTLFVSIVAGIFATSVRLIAL